MALLAGDVGVVGGDVAVVPVPLLVGDEGAEDGGEDDGLEQGLNSCGEEEHQASAAESYLRLGLVEQRELVPVPWSRKVTWTT